MDTLVSDSEIKSGSTVTEIVEFTEPDVAVILAIPAATACTSPKPETVAIASLEDDQTTEAPTFSVLLSV